MDVDRDFSTRAFKTGAKMKLSDSTYTSDFCQ